MKSVIGILPQHSFWSSFVNIWSLPTSLGATSYFIIKDEDLLISYDQ